MISHRASALLTLIFGDESNPHTNYFTGLCVRDTDSYLRARIQIAEYLRNTDPTASPLQIYIQGKRYRAWFADLIGIGEPFVTIREESIRRRLEEAWHTTLPEDLSAEELLSLDLETLPPPNRGVAEHILEYKVGKAWTQEKAGPTHAVQLLYDDLAKRDSKHLKEDECPWISAQKRKKVAVWETIASKAWQPFYKNYSIDASCTLHVVCTTLYLTILTTEDDYNRNILQEYLYDHPTSVLDEDAILRLSAEMRRVGDSELINLLTETGRQNASVYLLRFWKTKLYSLERGPGFIEHALEILPGHSAKEALALEQLLEESGDIPREPLTQDQHDSLHQRFGALSDACDILDRFSAYVLPDPPSDPGSTWMETETLDTWLPWLLHEYFPYRTAIDQFHSNVSPEQLEALEAQASRFSDWFCQHYGHMLRDGRNLVTTVGREIATRLDQGERIVWLVWDNLPVQNTAKVLKILQTQGFHQAQEIVWKLAVLPSVTKISFSASLSGLCPAECETVSSDDYSALVAKQFLRRQTIYRNSLREIATVLRESRDLYVFHYRQHDKVLHMAKSQLEDNRNNVLDMHTRRVAEQLAEAFSQMPADRPVSLIISTDHGSTRLPEQVARSISMPPGAELVEEHSSRALVIHANFDQTERAAYDPEACTYLDPTTYGLASPVLLARGFRTWSKIRRGSGYVHGGALPEEVLVPLLFLQRELRIFKPLSVDMIRGELRRSEVGEVTLLITNKNEYAVEHVNLHLSYEGRRLLTQSIRRLPANTSTESVIRIRIELRDSIRNNQVKVDGTISVHVLGRIEQSPVNIDIPAKERAVRSRSNEDLDDFFD